MKKSDGEGSFPNAQLPTMQIDALDPAQDVSLDDPDVAASETPSSEGLPPRSRATPPPLPAEASLPPSAPAPQSISHAPPPPQKKGMPIGILVGATVGALVVGGGIVALVVRSQPPAPTQPVVSVVHTSTPPTTSGSAATSAGVMTLPVIEFDDDKK